MATTTPLNGWPVPTSTDYVADGAVAIEALGDAIDTSVGSGLLAWTSFTPTLSQGTSTNISKTINYAKYAKLGKLVFCNIRLTSTGTGQSGQPVFVSLPITLATSSIPIGSGEFFDSGVNNYVGYVFAPSTTTAGLVTHNNSENFLGTNPNFAVANGDTINLCLTYEGV
jgi:hypothetical protein